MAACSPLSPRPAPPDDPSRCPAPCWPDHGPTAPPSSRLRLERANVWDHTHDLVLCTDYGTPIDPAQDQREWKALLRSCGVRQVRLHDARHTAATLLRLHGVDIRTVMAVMGWTQMATAQRYVYAIDELRHEAARRIGAALWSTSPDHREPIPGHRAPLGVVDARDPGLGR